MVGLSFVIWSWALDPEICPSGFSSLRSAQENRCDILRAAGNSMFEPKTCGSTQNHTNTSRSNTLAVNMGACLLIFNASIGFHSSFSLGATITPILCHQPQGGCLVEDSEPQHALQCFCKVPRSAIQDDHGLLQTRLVQSFCKRIKPLASLASERLEAGCTIQYTQPCLTNKL